jgi:hydroxymethylpyrimidine/phosphomethylpyrimidine kinase
MLASGKTVVEAVQGAKAYITEAIRYSLHIGGGQGPTNHFAPISHELDRYRALNNLKEAMQMLASKQCGPIIPEVQSNLGYALPTARSLEDVAAFPGRIVRVGEDCRVVCDPAFGASRHIARIILTVMKYDPACRSAMNIRFSEDILKACDAAGYAVEHFDRAAEPADVKEKEGASLEWGTEDVLKRRGNIPDVIFDRGEVGKEPMIRVLGKTPMDVANKVLAIWRQIKHSDRS